MKHLIGILLVMVMSVSMAGAQTPVSYSENGQVLFTVKVPDFWSVRTGGPRNMAPHETDVLRVVPRVLALEPTVGDGVWMGLMSPPGVQDLAAARPYLSRLIPFLALEAEVEAPVNRRIAGRPAEVYSGTGRREDRALTFTVAAIDLPNGRVAIVGAVLEASADPAFVNVLNGVFASFRAMR